MIKGILFDFGGVIADLDFDKCRKSFKEKAGFEDIDNFIDLFHQKGFWAELEQGRIGEEEFIEKCLEHSRPGATADTIFECFSDFIIGVKPEKAEFLREISRNYPIYILSNTNAVAQKVCRMKNEKLGFDLDSLFTKRFLSYEMGLMKPSPEIYLKAVEQTGFKAEELMFIDDSQKNIDAALAIGIQGVFYDVNSDLRETVLSALEKTA